MSHAAWNEVVPHLSATRRVIALDIAGFGRTPALPAGTTPTIAHLADALTATLVNLSIELPVDIAGNSLGGTMALEAAARGIARSVVAISPAGLWRTHEPFHLKYLFRSLRLLATRFPAVLKVTVRNGWLRELALAIPISIGSRRMSASDAVRIVDDLATAVAFEDTFVHTRSRWCCADASVPITVVFGTRDWVLPKWSRDRDALGMSAKWIERRGWGHVPMWSHPAGVAQLILDGTV